MCCQNIIDQQINRAYGSTPAAGPPPCPCAFSFGCAKSCDALHRGRLSTAKCLRSNHEFAAGPIFQKEMPSIWMAFLFGKLHQFKISAVFLVFSMVSAFWGKVFGACCFILLVAAVQPKKILWDLWNFVRSARFCQRSPL